MTYNCGPHRDREKSKFQSLTYSHFVYPKSLVVLHYIEPSGLVQIWFLSCLRFLFHLCKFAIPVVSLASKPYWETPTDSIIVMPDSHPWLPHIGDSQEKLNIINVFQSKSIRSYLSEYEISSSQWITKNPVIHSRERSISRHFAFIRNNCLYIAVSFNKKNSYRSLARCPMIKLLWRVFVLK